MLHAAFCLLTCAVLGLPAAERPSISFPEDAWELATPESQGLRSAHVTAAMHYLDAVCGKEGASQAMLIRNGRVVWQGADIDNKHLVWSCTKSFMSLSFGLLWDDGIVNPDMYGKDIYPPLAEHYPEVQLKHFATFTSGLVKKKDEPFTLLEPRYPVGKHYHYSGEPYMLSYLCTRLAGQKMHSLFKQRIADPIGIDADSWDWGSMQHPDGTEFNGGSGYPKSGVHITARSMARLGWLLANKGAWNGRQLVSEEFLAYATRVHWTYPAITAFDKDAWYNQITGCYGFLFWVNGVRPDGMRMWPHATEKTFALQGNKNNICIVIPEWRMVLVRLGTANNINTDLYDAALLTLRTGMRDEPYPEKER